MKEYLDLLQNILDNGTDRDDRTGTGTRTIFGATMRFDLRKGFPAVTTKKLAFNAIKSELLWFLEGSNEDGRLKEILHGSYFSDKDTIWTANANANYWKPKAKFDGDLGRVYGVQLRKWRTPVQEIGMHNGEPAFTVRETDQLLNLVDGLKNDPYSRRHIICWWNPGEIDQGMMALPACHAFAQFYVNSKNELSCMVTQRSCDVPVGLPFNISSYALFTSMLAQVCKLNVGELIMSLGDTHCYMNQIDGVKEQLTRNPLPLPNLWLNPEINDIEKFTMNDIKLIGYQSHTNIKYQMNV